MTSNSRRVLLMTALALYSLVVFVLDAVSPPGIEVWILNLPVILLPVFKRSRRLVVMATLTCSVLVAVGSIMSPPGYNPPSWDILNRTMGIVALWLIAAVAIVLIKMSTQLEDALTRLRREIDEHGQTRRELELNEERLRLATEGAGMGTFDVNLRTGKVVCSATHLRMLGTGTSLHGETTIDVWRSWVHPDDMPRVLAAREQALQSRSAYAIEHRINRMDSGQIAWLAVFGRYYYNPSGEAVRFLGVAFDITRRKELERDAVQHEVLAIAAREQRQIGQELHDGVGQELTGLGLMAQSLAQRIPQAEAERRITLRLLAGLDKVHQHVRELSRGLIPVHVETRGLSAALDDLAARTTEASGIAVTAQCPEWVELPDHATATQLYRIAQEAVSNAVRHGCPRHIRLSLLSEPSGLRLRINDDGIGIQGTPDGRDGLGLRIMQYRAGQIGGILQIGPRPGGGTVVSCTLPRSNGHDEKTCASCLDQGESLDRG